MNTWLLIDANYLCHRAFYTTGGLSHEGVGTGIAYGVVRAVEAQTDLHNADRVVFAFDWPGAGLRGQLQPDYKVSRRARREDDDPVKKAERVEFMNQVRRLERELLPGLGYRNVFSQRGYEADDVLAWWAEQIPAEDVAIIVTSDEDLWQCLSHNVYCHNPRTGKTTSAESFREEWGVDPVMWAHVKALAGCSSDDVAGVPGVGNKTAAKWFAGKLKHGTKAYRKITAMLDVINENLPLTSLPFDGCGPFEWRPDDLTTERRNQVFDELGFQRREPRKQQKQGFGLR